MNRLGLDLLDMARLDSGTADFECGPVAVLAVLC